MNDSQQRYGHIHDPKQENCEGIKVKPSYTWNIAMALTKNLEYLSTHWGSDNLPLHKYIEANQVLFQPGLHEEG